MGAERRRLYVYYRVQDRDFEAALQAARAMQGQLRRRWTGLDAELLARPGVDEAGRRTLMEVYARDGEPGGLDESLRCAIDAAAGQSLGRWIEGARHVEVFERCA